MDAYIDITQTYSYCVNVNVCVCACVHAYRHIAVCMPECTVEYSR